VFLFLSKTLDHLLSPFTWGLVLAVLAFFWLRTRPRRARVLLAVAVLELLFFSTESVSRWLYARLEAGVVSTFHPQPPYDVVVVLGGILEPSAETTGQLELSESGERVVTAADLLRAGQARDVLLTGGSVSPQALETPEAEHLARWLRAEGIAPERIVVEGQSRNTRENALFSAPIIAAHGWKRILIVTSAWHMPRALGCFRAVGIEADALPVDHRSRANPGFAWNPRVKYLANSTDALRELFGRIVYRVRGYAR
jgi:uncharacterized SAM-binding protein YcdF (DUF218 family)